MVNRVRRPEEFDDLLVELKNKGLFPTFKDALVFAAALGYRRGNRKSFQKSSEPIDMDVFRGDYDKTIMNIIAIEASGDPNMIAPSKEDERIEIFEEYANGGLDILRREIQEGRQEWRAGLLNLVQREEERHTLLDDITGLARLHD
ncbi:dnd system-associated protein 4 [Natronocella acetinitrilica]|uniref:Dnd system-associated protein 4 n=1 Tax=Natronocella acetinitrilica TaxID=414046 RepID=A0AAE3KHS3_9GAMM|nr:DNA phosphorothioation-associated protein 4 [Natronocella acetinitrilica]MCP1676642.1 dnd system-associated protein 4 [Natronocella acetinitrilica]